MTDLGARPVVPEADQPTGAAPAPVVADQPPAGAPPPTVAPVPIRPFRPRRFAVAVVAASLVAGGLAGGIVARVTRPSSEEAPAAGGAVAASATTAIATATPAPAGTGTATGAGAPSGPAGIGAPDPLQSLPSLIRTVSESVVAIEVTSTGTDESGRTTTVQAAGSGFVFAEGGLVATSAHVVVAAESITVTFGDGTKGAATVVGSDDDEDLAVIRVARTDLAPLELATDLTLQVGDFVIAAGNALDLEGSPTVTVGIVSALERTIEFDDGKSLSHLIQTDATISTGNSGGPLLSASGAVVGINTGGMASDQSTAAENIAFAIAIDRAAPVLTRLAAGAA